MQMVYDLHSGQQDKSEVPYIYHIIHVAEQMNTEDETINSFHKPKGSEISCQIT